MTSATGLLDQMVNAIIGSKTGWRLFRTSKTYPNMHVPAVELRKKHDGQDRGRGGGRLYFGYVLMCFGDRVVLQAMEGTDRRCGYRTLPGSFTESPEDIVKTVLAGPQPFGVVPVLEWRQRPAWDTPVDATGVDFPEDDDF